MEFVEFVALRAVHSVVARGLASALAGRDELAAVRVARVAVLAALRELADAAALGVPGVAQGQAALALASALQLEPWVPEWAVSAAPV